MDELTLDNKIYLSSRQAAKVTGYAKDYVGQLCREGRVAARLVGRNWYVLESSILEHRFGAERTEESPVAASAAVPSPWEAPVYTSEPVHMVPEMVAKPAPEPIPDPLPTPIAVSAPHEVLADMQSAWQEWFESQKEEEKLLPDASEMLLEAPPAVVVHEKMVTEPTPETPERPIHIERITDAPRANQSESVPVTRSYVRPHIQVATSRQQNSRYRGVEKTKRTVRSTTLLRTALLSIAGLAIVVTVIGSGAADAYLTGKMAAPITNIIGGVNTVNK
jgi:hypothetical protein